MKRDDAPTVDGGRLWGDLMELAAITDPAKPYTRRSFTPLFAQGRAWLAQSMEDAGLGVRIDAGGNLIGRIEGTDPDAGVIAIGSHSDSVVGGGRFDGIAGVLAGIAVARSLARSGTRLRSAIEVIDFLAEEPSAFGLSCIGSRAITGHLDAAMLAMTDPEGRILAEALTTVGGDPDRLVQARRRDLKAFLELHIEQGPVLEAAGIPVGIVTTIVGIRRIEVAFAGDANHAGTTPMAIRRDALVPAAETIAAVRDVASRYSAEAGGYFVATVGIVEVSPAAANVIPRSARIVIDARSSDSDMLQRFTQAIDEVSAAAARAAKVERSRFDILSDGVPAECSPALRRHLNAAADSLGIAAREMPSGAGHDAAFLALACPSAMLFVPSRDGKSHTPKEWTEPDALTTGAVLLLNTVLRVDADSGLDLEHDRL